MRPSPELLLSVLLVLPPATLVRAQPSPAAGTFASGTTFTRVTEGDLVTLPALYWGGSWGDYDDDGWLDLFVGATSNSTRNFLYHNERNGTFRLIDEAAMPKVPAHQHGAAWGDSDNDGDLDLIVTAGNPGLWHDVLYRNEGDGTFSWTADDAIYDDFYYADPGVHAAAWGDYDNDGFLDLYLAAHDVRNRLFHNEGDGSFTRITDHVLVNDPIDGLPGSSWVDFDADGDLDLFVSNVLDGATPTNVLYRNDRDDGFTKVTDSGISSLGQNTYASCWCDYDNDGFSDLFLANRRTNGLYRNDGDGSFTSVADSAVVSEEIPASALFSACAWGDYDNDGFVDLYVTIADFAFLSARPRSLLYHNEGDGTFTNVAEGSIVTDPTVGVSGASWGDYDNDGFLDLFVSQGGFAPRPQTNLLYHNDGNANAWLNVKLVGTVSNRSAIGAKVRVNAFFRGMSRWQLREISGGDSESNQQSLNAEFGLADATLVDEVRVEWPSGIVQELHGVTPRQFLVITETLPIEIVVAPGNGRRPIQPSSRAVIPVAVLGAAGLDVHEVDVSTLAFGPDGATPTRGKSGDFRDVNEDGFTDLVVGFRARDSGLERGDTEACLGGELREGTPFSGCAPIRTVPGRARGPRAGRP